MDEPGGGALDPLTPTVKLVSESAICTASEVAPRRRSRLLQRSGCTHQLTGNLRRHAAVKLTPRTRTQRRGATGKKGSSSYMYCHHRTVILGIPTPGGRVSECEFEFV